MVLFPLVVAQCLLLSVCASYDDGQDQRSAGDYEAARDMGAVAESPPISLDEEYVFLDDREDDGDDYSGAESGERQEIIKRSYNDELSGTPRGLGKKHNQLRQQFLGPQFQAVPVLYPVYTQPVAVYSASAYTYIQPQPQVITLPTTTVVLGSSCYTC